VLCLTGVGEGAGHGPAAGVEHHPLHAALRGPCVSCRTTNQCTTSVLCLTGVGEGAGHGPAAGVEHHPLHAALRGPCVGCRTTNQCRSPPRDSQVH
jgi:hypothetical protein